MHDDKTDSKNDNNDNNGNNDDDDRINKSSMSAVSAVIQTLVLSSLLPSRQELEVTARILLLKSSETNAFIRDDSERALSALVGSVTGTRALVALVAGGARSVRSPPVLLFSTSTDMNTSLVPRPSPGAGAGA